MEINIENGHEQVEELSSGRDQCDGGTLTFSKKNDPEIDKVCPDQHFKDVATIMGIAEKKTEDLPIEIEVEHVTIAQGNHGNSNQEPICGPCNSELASMFCNECKENMCERCSKVHRSSKATRLHDICSLTVAQNTPNKIFACEPCKVNGTRKLASFCCSQCEEIYCDDCARIHKNQKATKEHNISSYANVLSKLVCEPCDGNDTITIMKALCLNCDEGLCSACTSIHKSQKATATHKVVTLVEPTLNKNCQLCSENVFDTVVVCLCTTCIKYMCEACELSHRQTDSTKDHNTENIGSAEADIYRQELNLRHNPVPDTKSNYTKTIQLNRESANLPKIDPKKPQKVFVHGDVQADSLYLSWNEPQEKLLPLIGYQVRYKECVDDSRWILYPEISTTCTLRIQNLKSNSTYNFQVRMINNDTDGPYSENSDPIQTLQSAADRLSKFMYDVPKPDIGIRLRKVPLHEPDATRNTKAKTRKLYLGDDSRQKVGEKTILLVGATGSGKSTLVDGLMNYVLGVNWNDTYRLTLVDLEEDEQRQGSNQALSQTQWVTCYTINQIPGSRIPYKLNVIDTPGFGDTRGIERDRQVIEQIRQLFSASDQTGVLYIDAVCFLVKAPDARLTPTQKYIFESIMSMFGQDIKDNFCMLITFADGKRPPVLAALKEANLPHECYFPFNNSALFADNAGENVSSLSPMFWDMGMKSFAQFFEKLNKMETKSLQQTKTVLKQREVIEITIENLVPKVDAGLNKLEEMRLEINILERHKTEIEANKDFTYTVAETHQNKIDLPKGEHVTNCLNCHITCHRHCQIPNDEDKHRCAAMSNGYCTQCTDKCHWQQHKNTPYIFEYVTVEKTKSYAQKEAKYKIAKDEKVTRETVIARMQEELDDFESEIYKMMTIITDCNNTLRKIALRPDPLSVTEYIDLLIESEKLEKRAGFAMRISALNHYRKRSSIAKDVERFRSTFTDTRKKTLSWHVGKQPKKKSSNTFFSRFF